MGSSPPPPTRPDQPANPVRRAIGRRTASTASPAVRNGLAVAQPTGRPTLAASRTRKTLIGGGA